MFGPSYGLRVYRAVPYHPMPATKVPKRLDEERKVRLDADLLALLEADARAYERTVAASIRWHLRRALETAA